MRLLSWRPTRLLLAAAAAALTLAACGGSGDSTGSASIRLVNLSASNSSFDLADADAEKVLASGVAADQGSERAAVDAGETSFELRRAGNDSAVVTASWSLTKGLKYSAIAYGAEGALKMAMLEEDEDTPAAGKARLRLYNTSGDSGTLDLYLTAADTALEDASITTTVAASGATGFVTVAPGTYRLRLTASGDTSDLRLDLPAVTLDDRGVITLVLTAGSGGVLVHAATLAQDGGVTAYKNGSARVRLAAGATANAAIAASIGGQALATAQRAPSVGAYRLVTAGSALPLAGTVDGVALAAQALSLKAGADYTLMVHGEPAAAQAVLLTDDNRLPATGYAKIRLVNALAGLQGGLTLNVNYGALALEVATGEASSPATLAQVSAVPLEVVSPLASTPLFAIAEATLGSRSVYTVFMLGAAGTPYGILRRDR